jgi:dTDP-4-dehydrorhamnose reductase
MMLITGASGLLGANLALQWSDAGIDLTGLYHSHPVGAPGFAARRVDLLDEAAVRSTVRDLAPGWIIHCAAATNVDWCEAQPEQARRVNADGAGVVAATARDAGAGMIHISTDSVFDGERGGYAESDIPAPVNAYARSKLAGERAVLAAHPGALVVRTTIFGWNAQPKRSLAEWALARLEAGEDVPGWEDVTFNPLLVNDLGDLLLAAMERGLRGIYHFAGGNTMSKYAFAQSVARTFGYDESRVRPTSVEDVAFAAPRPRNTTLAVDKACDALGRPMPTVEAGLARFRQLRESGFTTRLKQLIHAAESKNAD